MSKKNQIINQERYNEYLNEALGAILEYKLIFVNQIWAFIGFGKSTFYDVYRLHENQDIQDALTKNRIMAKQSMHKKWHESDNATLQIALYKLMATDEELEKLTIQKVDNHHSGEIKQSLVKFVD